MVQKYCLYLKIQIHNHLIQYYWDNYCEQLIESSRCVTFICIYLKTQQFGDNFYWNQHFVDPWTNILNIFKHKCGILHTTDEVVFTNGKQSSDLGIL